MLKTFAIATLIGLIPGPALACLNPLLLVGVERNGATQTLQVVNGINPAVDVVTSGLSPDGYSPFRQPIITNYGSGQWDIAVILDNANGLRNCVYSSNGAVNCVDHTPRSTPNKAGQFLILNGQDILLSNNGNARFIDVNNAIGTPTIRAFSTYDNGRIYAINSAFFDTATHGQPLTVTVDIFNPGANRIGTTQACYELPDGFNVLDAAYIP